MRESRANSKATLGQRWYIERLINECADRWIELGEEIKQSYQDPELTAGGAAQIIDDLKFELGWKEMNELKAREAVITFYHKREL